MSWRHHVLDSEGRVGCVVGVGVDAVLCGEECGFYAEGGDLLGSVPRDVNGFTKTLMILDFGVEDLVLG